jgi:HEAT repeat protein
MRWPCLRDPSVSVRRRAADSLVEQGMASDIVVDALREVLNDPDKSIREEADRLIDKIHYNRSKREKKDGPR